MWDIWMRPNKWKEGHGERWKKRVWERQCTCSLPGFRVHVWRNAFIRVIPPLSNKSSVVWRASDRRAMGWTWEGGAVLEGARGFSVLGRANLPNAGLRVQGDLHVKASSITKGWKGAGQDLDNPFLFWWVVCFHAVRYWAAGPLYPHLLNPPVCFSTFCFCFVFRLFLIHGPCFFSFTWIGVMEQCNVKQRLEQLLSWLYLKAKQRHENHFT